MAHKSRNSNKKQPDTPEFAPGNYDLLEESPSREEKREDDTTRVTRLSYDEVDPG